MKIVAAINKQKFLVEMGEDEIVKAAGFSTTYNTEWEKLNGGRDIKVGSVIDVTAAYDFHHRILSDQKSAGSAANTLRALADLIGGALPDVVIPPPAEGIFENEAFVVWHGLSEMPDLGGDTIVEIETRDGRTDRATVKRIWWKHSSPEDKNFNNDVIRFRVVSTKGGAA